MTVFIQLTTAGTDTGPFSITANDGPVNTVVETDVTRDQLLAGHSVTVPDNTISVVVTSIGVCKTLIVFGTGITSTSSTTV